MERVRIFFRRLSIPEKIQKARTLVMQMDGNIYFSNPLPALKEVRAVADDLEQAYEAAMNRSKIQMARQRQCESILIERISMLAAYVQNVSMGDGGIILSSGFDLQQAKKPLVITAPLNINGRSGPREGEVTLAWDCGRGAKAYNVEMSPDGISGWSYCGSSTKRRMTVGGLASGTKCFFRVAALGSRGQSGWSDPGMGRAL